jgi:hypothetical protein
MGLLVLILVIVAGLLAVLDLVLGYTGNARRFALTPIAVILICIALVVSGAGAGALGR